MSKYKEGRFWAQAFGPVRKTKVRYTVYRVDNIPGIMSFRSHRKALNKAKSMGIGTHINRDVVLIFRDGSSFSFCTDYNVIK